MNYYQVNQRETFPREFTNGYLCCPEGNRGGWPLMLKLQVGDVLFHYSSLIGAVTGISRVLPITKHKGPAGSSAVLIGNTQCIKYQGRHLSEADFTEIRRMELRQKYNTYYEVHTFPILKAELGKLLRRVPQAYLVACRGEFVSIR